MQDEPLERLLRAASRACSRPLPDDAQLEDVSRHVLREVRIVFESETPQVMFLTAARLEGDRVADWKAVMRRCTAPWERPFEPPEAVAAAVLERCQAREASGQSARRVAVHLRTEELLTVRFRTSEAQTQRWLAMRPPRVVLDIRTEVAWYRRVLGAP